MAPRFTAGRVPPSGIAPLFTVERRWQRWLEVEAALAQAQGALGIVPVEAAQAITAACRLEALDLETVRQDMLRTSHPLMAVITELGRVVGEPHGGWVHWGVTTQNIMQTGDVLVLREAHRAVLAQLARNFDALAGLAERGADFVMAGRTHGQHAVPITFGFKVAAWIDETIRNVSRLRELEPRLFVALVGGAVGSFEALGPHGVEIQDEVSRRLGLRAMAVPARTAQDQFAEFVTVLGILAGTSGKIAREIYTLMKTEYREVEEPVPVGTVGSSTMPQKRNPQLCQDVLGMTSEIRALVPLALEAIHNEHEADHAPNVLFDAQARACALTGDVLERLDVILSGLQLDPARMRANLDLSGGLISAEAVMIELGELVGRQRAHQIVYEAAQESATSGRAFLELLAVDMRVTAHLSGTEIERLLDAATHTGQSALLARTAAHEGRIAAERLRRHLRETDVSGVGGE